ncbi:hypothetical protein BG004_001355 [Podila humilis]|nr:hypothetical protein BG004_001355 [Podila humilis]
MFEMVILWIEGRQLPWECIIPIIHELRDDQAALHNLLTVSRMFFYETLPVLVDKVTREKLSPEAIKDASESKVARQKFFELVIASILHYPKEILPYPTHLPFYQPGCTQPPKSPSTTKLLDWFGLKLDCPLPDTILEYSKPMVDYSKFAILQDGKNMEVFGLSPMLNLVVRPMNHPERNYIDDCLAREESNEHSRDLFRASGVYKSVVTLRFGFVLLHRHPDRKTELSVHIRDFLQFIPALTHMSRLQMLALQREKAASKGHKQSVMYFVQHHQAAFPSKLPLSFIDVKTGALIIREANETMSEFALRLSQYFELTCHVYNFDVQD